MNSLAGGNFGQPVGEHARPESLPRIDFDQVIIRIDDAAAAEGHTDEGRLEKGLLHAGIESGQHLIILMQKMHEVATGKPDGAVPVAGDSQMAPIHVDIDPTVGIDRPHEFDHIRVPRSVVHNRDLHLFGRRRLRQHRLERPPQLFAGLVGGQHHREPRPVRVAVHAGHERDGRRG